MNKKIIIILSIILTIYLLFIIKLKYDLNIISWIGIYFYNILPKSNIDDNVIIDYINQHPVYISMTTNPERIKVLPTIIPLFTTEYIHEIHINIPLKYKNTEEYDIEDIHNLEKLDKVRIFRINEDLGPVTKILPTLKRVKDKDSIIISLDDDILYTKYIINKLIENSIKYPNEIIGSRGYRFKDRKTTNKIKCFDIDNSNKWWVSKPEENKPYVDIIEGYGGIAYKKRLVNISLLEKLNTISCDCKFSDDLTINYALASYNIKRRKIPYSYIYIFPLSNGQENGLSRQNPPDNYYSYNLYRVIKCIEDINNENYINNY